MARSRAMLAALVLALFVGGCAAPPPIPRETSRGHLRELAPAPQAREEAIPEPVRASPVVPLPDPSPTPVETYTVVVNQVPVKELLFALARDAQVNVDVHPDITGDVTINAIDQTLPQILDRVSRQLSVRYQIIDGTIVVSPDSPFLRAYNLDYVNVVRESTSTVETSTQVATVGSGPGDSGGGSGGNASDSKISNTSNNQLWDTLQTTIESIVRPSASAEELSEENAAGGRGGTSSGSTSDNVIINKESGIIMVRATESQHLQVQRYLDTVASAVTRQVLIEATIVEVELNDRYQAGINWGFFSRDGGTTGAGVSAGSDLTDAFISGAGGAVSGLFVDAANAALGSVKRSVSVSLRALSEFGDVRVISSPKVMALNNQPAVLKVVDNEVYFTVEVDEREDNDANTTRVDVRSEVNVVPVGLILNVTPQVAANDAVTLNVRPTVTRIREFVNDPGLAIIAGFLNTNVDPGANRVPVVQVRETETVMRVNSGQLAILGGLMQDRLSKDDEGVPGLQDIDVVGDLFKFRNRDQVKTELVIFIKPSVIRSPDVGGDLERFAEFLPDYQQQGDALKSPTPQWLQPNKQ